MYKLNGVILKVAEQMKVNLNLREYFKTFGCDTNSKQNENFKTTDCLRYK